MKKKVSLHLYTNTVCLLLGVFPSRKFREKNGYLDLVNKAFVLVFCVTYQIKCRPIATHAQFENDLKQSGRCTNPCESCFSDHLQLLPPVEGQGEYGRQPVASCSEVLKNVCFSSHSQKDSKDNMVIVTKLKCAAGVAELATRKYKPAAKYFLQASFDHCDFSEVSKGREKIQCCRLKCRQGKYKKETSFQQRNSLEIFCKENKNKVKGVVYE